MATLKNILFAYEPQSESIVIGPIKLNQRVILGPELGSGTVPQVHEFGATVKIREARVGRKWLSGRRRIRPGHPVRVRSAKYSPRPFMGPAMEAEKDNIPDAWFGSL